MRRQPRQHRGGVPRRLLQRLPQGAVGDLLAELPGDQTEHARRSRPHDRQHELQQCVVRLQQHAFEGVRPPAHRRQQGPERDRDDDQRQQVGGGGAFEQVVGEQHQHEVLEDRPHPAGLGLGHAVRPQFPLHRRPGRGLRLLEVAEAGVEHVDQNQPRDDRQRRRQQVIAQRRRSRLAQRAHVAHRQHAAGHADHHQRDHEHLQDRQEDRSPDGELRGELRRQPRQPSASTMPAKISPVSRFSPPPDFFPGSAAGGASGGTAAPAPAAGVGAAGAGGSVVIRGAYRLAARRARRRRPPRAATVRERSGRRDAPPGSRLRPDGGVVRPTAPRPIGDTPAVAGRTRAGRGGKSFNLRGQREMRFHPSPRRDRHMGCELSFRTRPTPDAGRTAFRDPPHRLPRPPP